MRVITANSVYTVKISGALFHVRRTASMWGQQVRDNHEHYSASITLGVGMPLITSCLETSEVVAILPE